MSKAIKEEYLECKVIQNNAILISSQLANNLQATLHRCYLGHWQLSDWFPTLIANIRLNMTSILLWQSDWCAQYSFIFIWVATMSAVDNYIHRVLVWILEIALNAITTYNQQITHSAKGRSTTHVAKCSSASCL